MYLQAARMWRKYGSFGALERLVISIVMPTPNGLLWAEQAAPVPQLGVAPDWALRPLGGARRMSRTL
jgi:hypothetical protein